MPDFDYSTCLFQARLQKSAFFRKNQQFYLYVSQDKIIINRVPYSKKPDIILQLLPTTHVKWLWETKKDKKGTKNMLKGFIIETQGYLNEFVAQNIVLQMLKLKFKQITLQSDFYDQYTLGKYIDKGNYAQVYECFKKDSNRKYAVKILQKERLKTIKNGKESVFNQLKILRTLHHKNLMTLFQVFEDRNKYYFILQLLQGTTLYKQIQSRKNKKQFKSNQIRGIVKQILEGVKYLQKQNIMHRDIKPENILFQDKDSLDKNQGQQGLKIVDYGLATFQDQKNIIFTKCGTPGFVAPEIITYDEKQPIYKVNVDVFSIGVILHILLVGQQSFPGRSRNTILNKNKQCRIDFKSKKYQAIATDGVDLLSKLLQKNPQKRITASQALQHAFFTKDRPIFKFKKVLTADKESQYKNYQMKMYQNLEQLANEQMNVSPAKNREEDAMSSTSSFYKQNTISKYLEDLVYYDPFSHQIYNQKEPSNQLINSNFQDKPNRKIINSICRDDVYESQSQRSRGQSIDKGKLASIRSRKGSDGTQYLLPNIESYEDAQNFFDYLKSKPS